MKDLYTKPELEITYFESEDVINTSGGEDEDEFPLN